LEDRIERLKSATAHSQDPRSRMSRVISNVEIDEGSDGLLTVYSTFNLTELRRGHQNTYAGRNIHILRPENGSFRIVQKKVLLVNNDEVINNLTFLV
jgi:3-phenylpropionate/cinnamic acid dioxygenase small subunit